MNPHERPRTSRWLYLTCSRKRESNRNAPCVRNESVWGARMEQATATLQNLTGSFPNLKLVLLKLTWFYSWKSWVHPAMSSDTFMGAYFTLGIANSSITWVSGTGCLFSRKPHSLCFWLDWNKWIRSIFHHKYNALGENTAANQTDHIFGCPSTQYSAWHTVGTEQLFSEQIYEWQPAGDWEATTVFLLTALGLWNHRLPSHLLATFNFSWPVLCSNLTHTLKIMDHDVS